MERFSPVQAHKLKQPKTNVDGIEITEHKTDTSIEYTATDGKYTLSRVVIFDMGFSTTKVIEKVEWGCIIRNHNDSKFSYLFKALYKYRFQQ